MPKFKIESKLAASSGTLKTELLTMDGVNYELYPLVTMKAPDEWEEKHLRGWPVRKFIFSSVIMLFGFIPVDRHQFKLISVEELGFEEESSSTVNKIWNHKRQIVIQDGHCKVIDEVEYQGRVRLLAHLMLAPYKFIFRHRHNRLFKKYGTVEK